MTEISKEIKKNEDCFKKLAEETGIPYQNLIDLYLDDCVKKGLKPDIKWQHPA